MQSFLIEGLEIILNIRYSKKSNIKETLKFYFWHSSDEGTFLGVPLRFRSFMHHSIGDLYFVRALEEFRPPTLSSEFTTNYLITHWENSYIKKWFINSLNNNWRKLIFFWWWSVLYALWWLVLSLLSFFKLLKFLFGRKMRSIRHYLMLYSPIFTLVNRYHSKGHYIFSYTSECHIDDKCNIYISLMFLFDSYFSNSLFDVIEGWFPSVI